MRVTGKGLERGSATRINPFVYWMVRGAARIFLAPFFELQVSGQENVPRKGSFILLPKHQRWEDIPLLGLSTPLPLYYVAKNELFTNRLSRWFISTLGGIPLNRRQPLASRNSIEALVRLLNQGAGVVIFPEGTYYRNCMGAGHAGLIRLIHSRVEVPFIPVGVGYSGRGARTLVQVRFGKAVPWGPSAEPETFLASAMQEIGVLSGLLP